MAEDHVARVVLGQTTVDEVFKLAHCSSKPKRRKKRKGFKRQHQDELHMVMQVFVVPTEVIPLFQ